VPPLGLPGPAPRLGEPPGTAHYEIPIAIQDRSFYQDGSLAYPGSRADFDGYRGPYLPETPVHPVWNPEVFGNTMVVNGRTWPSLRVEARRYRFRLLNACNTRVLMLKVVSNPLAPRPATIMWTRKPWLAKRTSSPLCSVPGPRKPNSMEDTVAWGVGRLAGELALAIVNVVSGGVREVASRAT